MVLGSQQPRDSLSRSYMMTRRRRSKRWPVLIVLIAVSVGGIWLFARSGSDPAPSDAAAEQATTGQSTTGQTTQNANAGASGSSSAGSREQPRPVTGERYELPRIVENDNQPEPTSSNNQANDGRGQSASARDTTPRFTAPDAGNDTAFAEPLRRGMRLVEQGDLVAGRSELSALLVAAGDRLRVRDAQAIRDTLASVNERLIFSPEAAPNDPLTTTYTVKSGDLLIKIAPRFDLTYQFIERINNVAANRIRVGQDLKLIYGPFHAVVDRSDFRMDIYLEGPDGEPVYIRSFAVGLGEQGSTPIGNWVVRKGGKVSNPAWTNPRTGKFFEADHPENPLGQYWIALDGTDPSTKELQGYGIHGTIEPDTIGTEASMGCVRLADADIERVYQLLVGGKSRVQIVR